MEHILTHTFLTEWKKIQEKIEAIRQIGGIYESGECSDGYEIDETGIIFKTKDQFRCSCCTPDYYSFAVLWEDLNKPIEWFKEQNTEYQRRESERETKHKEEEKDRLRLKEIQQLKELKEKYPHA